VVERLQGGELFLVLFDEVGQLVEQTAALAGAQLRPGPFLERLAGGLGGPIDVGLVPLGHLADGLAGGGVEGGEGLARDTIDPLAADEHRLILDLGWLDAAGLRGGRGSHESILRWNRRKKGKRGPVPSRPRDGLNCGTGGARLSRKTGR